MNKTFGEKIHINNCLEFYKNTDFELRFSEIKKMTHFMSEKKWEKKFKDNFFKFIESSIKGKDLYLEHIYFQLCEIIHPTSVIINSHNDKTTNLNYRAILNTFLSTQIIPNGIACASINLNMIETIKNKKEIFTEQFDLFLNKLIKCNHYLYINIRIIFTN